MKTVECDVDEESAGKPVKPTSILENFVGGQGLHHNYKLSHDGKQFLSFSTRSGVDLFKDGKRTNVPGSLFTYELLWDPTNRYFAFMTMVEGGQAVRVVDSLPDPPRVIDVYTLAAPGMLRGIEWSPRGGEIYWIENTRNEDGLKSRMKRCSILSKKPVTLVDSSEHIDFFMPPVSWFQNGQGATTRDYSIVYGTGEGLFLLSRDGKTKRVLCQAPAAGLNNLEWSPDGKHIIMYFVRSYRSRKLGLLRGVMLAHLHEKDPEKIMENLYEGTDIHTLWFSPGGRFATWAKETGVWFRKPDDFGKPGFKVPNPVIEKEGGSKVVITDKPIKGFMWNDDSTRLAITARNQIWVFNALTRVTTLHSEFGTHNSHFLAEPVWRGSRLVFTIFEDMALTGRELPKPKEGQARNPFADTPEAKMSKREWIKRERARAAKAAKKEKEKRDKKKG